MKESAGILAYRRRGPGEVEVLLVHPAGWYNRNRPWSIPKGLPTLGETLEQAARRETWEEAGVAITGPLADLGTATYGAKVVYGFAAEAPSDAEPKPDQVEV